MARILIVSGSPKGAEAFAGLLTALSLTDIHKAGSGAEAHRLLAAQSFALIVILSPLPDEFGSELAKAAAGTTAGVMLVVRAELAEEMAARLQDKGIFVFSPDMGRRLFDGAVRLLMTIHRRLAAIAPQTERLQQTIQDIRLADRAKCLLIQYERLTEQEAHRYMEKEAMNRRLSKREIAEEILANYGEI